jgi:hypothetical protein
VTDVEPTPEENAAARERLLEELKTMRAAADLMRHGHFGTMTMQDLADAVADWIDGECAILGEMEPYADILNAAISKSGGPQALLVFARHENGDLRLSGDTSDHARRIVNLLGEKLEAKS